MTIEKIKQFVEEFCEVEAKAYTLRRKPNLEAYNKCIEQMYSYTNYIAKIGILSLNSLQDKDYYKRYEKYPDSKFRKIFKISKYKHHQYNQIWIAYVSGANPDPDFDDVCFDHAFFIILEESKLKLVKYYVYSDYPDRIYSWKEQGGLAKLNFDSLEKPIEIQRYLEPDDEFDGLKHYYDNI